MGLPKTSVWFWYIFEAGRLTVCVCDLWPGDRGFCSLLFYCLMRLPKTSAWFWYIFEAGRMTVCVWPMTRWLRFLFSSFLLSYGVAQNICLVLVFIWGWEDDCVCRTSGQVIELFVLSFLCIMGLPKTSVWFRYLLDVGRMTVCVWPLTRWSRILFSSFLLSYGVAQKSCLILVYLGLGGWLCVWPLARWSRLVHCSPPSGPASSHSPARPASYRALPRYTDKKENRIFLIYIGKFRWARLQSHVWGRASYIIYEEMRKYWVMYEEAVSHISRHNNITSCIDNFDRPFFYKSRESKNYHSFFLRKCLDHLFRWSLALNLLFSNIEKRTLARFLG